MDNIFMSEFECFEPWMLSQIFNMFRREKKEK